MKKLIFLVFLMLEACLPQVVYYRGANADPDTTMTMDEAACGIVRNSARNDMYPTNPFLNAEAGWEAYDLCMISKGYSRGK